MTLIVGVRCDEGVVIGADSAATFGVLGQQTIRQNFTKIEIVAGQILFGVSGPVGLAQRLSGELESAWNGKKFRGMESWEVMTAMREQFHKHIAGELEAARVALPVVGGPAQTSAITHTVVAMPVKNQACLFQFDHQGAPEEQKLDLPFVCAGSGQLAADPFLAFLKDIFWKPRQYPSIPDALFCVHWTLRQAIEVTPGGIADPIQLFTLAHDSGEWQARELSNGEREEQEQAIDDAKSALRDFRSGLQESDETVEEPPEA